MCWIKRHSHKVAVGVLITGLIFIALHCGSQSLGAEAELFMESEGLFLPFGNMEEGRKAFIKLKCYSCHQVYFDRTLPAPTTTTPGPVLGSPKSLHKTGEMMDSIVSPSRHLFPGFEESKNGKLSRMGKFGQIMTVQELIDITEYLMVQEE